MNAARAALRIPRARIRPGEWAAILLLVACSTAVSLAGCQRAPPATEAPAAEAKDKPAPEAEGVTLKPEEVEKAGIRTTTLAASSHAPESTGYAVVITREAIAQAVADLTSAAAVERQSRSALTRARSLAGTPGAMPIEAQEAAERQATVDHAAFVLAERRLSATYGQNSPWKENYNSPLLGSLARGDATIPGRSFFAILKGGDVSEGERLIAHAAVGAAENGVLVPYSATVISGGKYWGYVEEKPGLFVRAEIDPSMPTDDGYFVKEGIAPGAQVVTSSAGLLLAHETNPSTEAD